jgi:hypothetical protein
MRKKLWWVGVAVLTLALVGQFVAYTLDHPPALGKAVWAFQPKSFADVVDNAQTVVQAQVVRVEAGPDIVTKAPGEPNGEDRIPTQRVTVNVQSVDKGNTSVGQTLVVFRTGGPITTPDAPRRGSIPGSDTPEQLAPPKATGGGKGDPNATAPDRPAPKSNPNAPASVGILAFEVDDDPVYLPGESYLLALTAGPNDTLRPVSPEGRYRITGNNTLQAVTDSIVGASVNGVSVATADAAVKGQTVIPNRPAIQKRVTTEPVPGMPTTGTPFLDAALMTIGTIALLTIIAGFVLRRRRA